VAVSAGGGGSPRQCMQNRCRSQAGGESGGRGAGGVNTGMVPQVSQRWQVGGSRCVARQVQAGSPGVAGQVAGGGGRNVEESQNAVAAAGSPAGGSQVCRTAGQAQARSGRRERWQAVLVR